MIIKRGNGRSHNLGMSLSFLGGSEYISNDGSGINEDKSSLAAIQISAEDKRKEEKRQKSQFWDVKASFVAGCCVSIAIVMDIVEYCGIIFNFELPYWVKPMCASVCVVLTLLILGTKRFDKYLNSKGVEKYGAFLTPCSVLVFIIENSFYKSKMDTMTAISLCLLLIGFVIGAVCLLFSRYKK